jgi:hypothetical protein
VTRQESGYRWPPPARLAGLLPSFLIYRRGALTLVFWQEGDVICVLASDIAPEAAVALAFAKAVKL